MRRFDEAIVVFRQAIELDRLNMAILSHPGWHYGVTENYEQAVRECEKALEVDPNHFPTLYYLRTALIGLGDFDGVLRVAEKLGEVTPASGAVLSRSIRTEGPRAYWQWRLDRTLANSSSGPIDSEGIARMYARLGQADKALRDSAKNKSPSWRPRDSLGCGTKNHS